MLGLLFIVWAVISLGSLLSYPAPYVEDGWMGTRGHEFLTRGDFGLTTHLDFSGSSQNWRSVGRLYVVGMALFYKLAGFGLAQARLFSLLGSATTAWFIYRLGARFSGPVEGLLGALLSLAAWRGFYAGHLARPESWVLAAGAACLYVAFNVRNAAQPWKWLALGLLAGLFLDVHAIFIHFLSAVTCVVIWVTLISQRQPRNCAAYVAGVLLGLAYFGLVHFLPDPRSALEQYRQFTPTLAEGGVAGYSIWRQALASLRLWQSATWGFTRASPLEQVILLASLAVLLVKRTKENLFLLAASVGLVLSYIFANPGYNPRHVAVLVPLTSLVIARAAYIAGLALAERLKVVKLAGATWAVMLAAPLLAVYLLGDAILAWNNRTVAYQPYADELRRLVPPGANVLGEEYWYFEFNDGRFTSDFLLTEDPQMRGAQRAARLQQLFRDRQIEYVLLDEQLAQDFDGTPLPEVERDTLHEYVGRQCQSVGRVTGYLYGVESGGPRLKTTEVYDCRA